MSESPATEIIIALSALSHALVKAGITHPVGLVFPNERDAEMMAWIVTHRERDPFLKTAEGARPFSLLGYKISHRGGK